LIRFLGGGNVQTIQGGRLFPGHEALGQYGNNSPLRPKYSIDGGIPGKQKVRELNDRTLGGKIVTLEEIEVETSTSPV